MEQRAIPVVMFRKTSCEWNNQLLSNRRMLTPLIDYEELAYFNI